MKNRDSGADQRFLYDGVKRDYRCAPLAAAPNTVPYPVEMAFMVPVMKKDFDLYKNRRISESVPTRKMSADHYKATSTSLSTSPSSASAPAYGSPSMAAFTQRMQNRAMTRTSSRASQSSLVTSPTRGVNMTSSSSAGSSGGSPPPKASSSKGSQGSLNKFHSRLVDKLKRSLKRESNSKASRS